MSPMRRVEMNLSRAVDIANAILRENDDPKSPRFDRLTNEEASAVATLTRYAYPAAWGNLKRGDAKEK